MSDWLGPCWHGVDYWRRCDHCKDLPEATVISVSLGAENSALLAEVRALRARAEAADHEVGYKMSDIQVLRTELAALREELKDTQDGYDELNALLEDANIVLPGDGRLSVRIAALRAERDGLEARATTAWNMLEALGNIITVGTVKPSQEDFNKVATAFNKAWEGVHRVTHFDTDVSREVLDGLPGARAALSGATKKGGDRE